MIHNVNPYRPGAGRKPKYLAGRDAETERALQIIETLSFGDNSRPVLYYGLRGVGKTVLLSTIEEMADNRNILYKTIEVKEKSGFVKQLSIACNAFVSSLSVKEELMDKFDKLKRVLGAFTLTWSAEEQSVSISPGEALSAMSGTGDLQNDLTELIVSLGKYAKESGESVIFFIDELQYAKPEELEALITALHRAAQLDLPVMVFGAGLNAVIKKVGDIKTYSERLFEFRKIDSLSKEDAYLAITKPAEDFNVKYDDDAVDAIFDITGGYPYFIQELCDTIWSNHNADTISKDVVDMYVPEYIEKLDSGFYRSRYDRCTQMEREFLWAMAKCDKRPCHIAKIAEQMNRTAQSIGTFRAKLVSKGMIYPVGHGEIDFTVPKFDSYLKRTMESR